MLGSMDRFLQDDLVDADFSVQVEDMGPDHTLALSDHLQQSGPLPQQQEQQHCPVGDRRGLFSREWSHDELFSSLLRDPRLKRYRPHALSTDPWILQFDTLYSEAECQELIQDCSSWVPDIAGGVDQKAPQRFRNSSSFNCHNGDP